MSEKVRHGERQESSLLSYENKERKLAGYSALLVPSGFRTTSSGSLMLLGLGLKLAFFRRASLHAERHQPRDAEKYDR